MNRLGAVILVTCIALIALAPAFAQEETTRPSTTAAATTSVERSSGKAIVIPLRGMIDDFGRDALFKRFDKARALGADTVILDVNTYGGLVTSGLDISRFLKQQKDLHVIAYVGEKAISAGVMIALAADEVYMAPSALMGDSAPIAMGESLGRTERAKAESPILEDFYDSAVRNGYDPTLTQSMVSLGRSVHWVEDPATGTRRFVDAAQYKTLTTDSENPWKPVAGVRDPVDGPDTLLTVHTDLAVKVGLARGVATSIDDLASQRKLNIIARFEPSGGESFVSWLNSPLIRLFFIVLFMGSLFIALHTPGHGGAEALAMITLGALVGIPLLTGHAQWWEVLAILVGLALIALELFVIPGFGVVGIAGIGLFFAGLLMTFVGPEPVEIPGWLPTLATTWTALRQGLYSVAVAMAVSLMLWFWLSKYLPRLPYFNRLILSTTAGSLPHAALDPASFTPEGPVVGDHGEAISDLKPSGQVRLLRDGRIVSVISEGGFLKSGASVIVREIGGNRVVVRERTRLQSGSER